MAEGDVLRVRSGRIAGQAPVTTSTGAAEAGRIPALDSAGKIDTSLLPSWSGSGEGLLGSPQVLWSDLAETSTIPPGATSSGITWDSTYSRRIVGAGGSGEIKANFPLGDFFGVTAVFMCPSATGACSIGIRRISGGVGGSVGYLALQGDGNTVIYINGVESAAPGFKSAWAGYPIVVRVGVAISTAKVLVEYAPMGAITGYAAGSDTSPSSLSAGDTIEAYIRSPTGEKYSAMIVHRGMPI